jgi:hypothetical protein
VTSRVVPWPPASNFNPDDDRMTGGEVSLRRRRPSYGASGRGDVRAPVVWPWKIVVDLDFEEQ